MMAELTCAYAGLEGTKQSCEGFGTWSSEPWRTAIYIPWMA
jgi:hypothetical protein